MDERDLEAEETCARPLVDQIGAGPRELDQGRVEVAHLVRNVVHPWTALRQEPADRRVLAERLEQLHPPGADAERSSSDALVLHRRDVLDLCTEQTLIRRERCIEIFDHDTQMVDPPCRHSGDSIERRGVSGLG